MGFTKGDTSKLQETDLTTFTRTCVGTKLTFTGTGSNNMTELQTRWWLDDKQTLSDKELYAVAYGSDKEIEEHNLEKLEKDKGEKAALFILKDTAIIGFIKLSVVVMFDVIKFFD